ncbi:MAG TPA: peptidoglycan DD-metalloendopeptidase family protein [Thermoanaerobaculia bacterium]|nr:peptidoglycan DD-metalloendopeptidase family protein [Thermoanaerobaculia bacterium]
MKRLVAFSERLGGYMRVRAFFAVFPLAIPLILTTADTSDTKAVAGNKAGITATSPAIRYEMLEAPQSPLPDHTTCLAIENGDTLDSLFVSGGLSPAEAFKLAGRFGESVDVRKLRNGDLVRFRLNAANEVRGVDLRVTGWGSVAAERDGADFAVRPNRGEQRVELKAVAASIGSSLYESVRKQGETPQLVQQLVDMFQWDVDFFALQKGDWFSLVVEKKFCGQDHVGYGPIVAARFHHEGETYEAFRFESGGMSGYYTAAGRPVKKQFLRAPLQFTRITSGFSLHRFHPILHEFRAHHGVDYGAPVGTPVMSTADGVVNFAGYNRGEGNYVRIRHNARIQTSYLHLSRFAKGIHDGSKVQQGQVIGYVGATGLATGPHLDYRVCDGSTWINPLQLKSITADPLGGPALRAFRGIVSGYLHRLENASAATMAAAQTRHPFSRS